MNYQAMQKTWRNLKCIITKQTKPVRKAIYCMFPTIWHLEKKKPWKQ